MQDLLAKLNEVSLCREESRDKEGKCPLVRQDNNMTTALTDEDDKQHQVVNYNRNAGVCIVTMTVINVNSFRYDIMLRID